MKTLYLDCQMGAAGDMLTAALLELMPDPAETVSQLNNIGIPHVEFIAEPTVKGGITGTHMSVLIRGQEEPVDAEPQKEEHQHGHHGHSLADVERIISSFSVKDTVKKDAVAVYTLIAEAESKVHGKPVTDIHFHEVGTMDAIADVTAVCYLMNNLNPDTVIASPVHVGSGTVKCAHGILPVPAPATALLLEGIPTYGGSVKGELCTPTGTALLKHFVHSFGPQPAMNVENVGYGCGKKEFEQANVVRASFGDALGLQNSVIELSCNLDDMTPEEIAFATEELLDRGALDVYTTAIGMKKNRPGILLTVMCREADREDTVRSLFQLTTTIGIREKVYERYILDRTEVTEDTVFGPVRKKVVSGYGVTREKYEYEDLAKIARENELSIKQVRSGIKHKKKLK